MLLYLSLIIWVWIFFMKGILYYIPFSDVPQNTNTNGALALCLVCTTSREAPLVQELHPVTDRPQVHVQQSSGLGGYSLSLLIS